MIEFGKINTLKVIKIKKSGIVMDGGASGEVFLPQKEAPDQVKAGDNLEVFIFMDAKSQIIATRTLPLAMADQFAYLKVITSNSYGTFLYWGLKPDLRVSLKEQKKKMKIGQSYPVYVFNDKDNRTVASSRIEKYLKSSPGKFTEGQRVNLVIAEITPAGYKAIINNSGMGMLFKNEVFQLLKPGQAVKGFIKKIREDGKIDLVLQKSGAMEVDLLSNKILKTLKENNGRLDISDKTDPERIYSLFGVSKKRYKSAIGNLYKKRLIMIGEHGIRLGGKPNSRQAEKPARGRRRIVRRKK